MSIYWKALVCSEFSWISCCLKGRTQIWELYANLTTHLVMLSCNYYWILKKAYSGFRQSNQQTHCEDSSSAESTYQENATWITIWFWLFLQGSWWGFAFRCIRATQLSFHLKLGQFGYFRTNHKSFLSFEYWFMILTGLLYLNSWLLIVG